MTKDDIKTRLKEVQLAATLDTMLTIRQKREYLARIVRARVSVLADDSDLWQITITEDGVTRKPPDKLCAIALDNELSGEGAQENREDVTVVVRIGGQDNEGAPFNTHRPPLRFDAENDGHSRQVQDRVTAGAMTIEQAQDLSATATLLDRYEFRESSCRLTPEGNGPLTGSAASTVD